MKVTDLHLSINKIDAQNQEGILEIIDHATGTNMQELLLKMDGLKNDLMREIRATNKSIETINRINDNRYKTIIWGIGLLGFFLSGVGILLEFL